MADLSKLSLPAAVPSFSTDARAENAIHARLGTANLSSELTLAAQTPNTDETKWTDFSGSYSKALPQSSPGIVNPVAFSAFRRALGTSDGKTPPAADFEAIPAGLGAKLNGPQGAFALQPLGWDSQSFTVKAAYTVDSPEYAVELIELYWASLLRDLPFADYKTSNPLVKMAVDELTNHVGNYKGPKVGGAVTPELLFRGGFPGETVGPYLSQLCIFPTNLGVQPLDQAMQAFTPGRDFMTDLPEWFKIQGGGPPSETLSFDPMHRYMQNGRALAAFTHVDELYQAYLTAYLVMNSWEVPLNVGTRYSAASTVGTPFKIQKPFGTFAGPDVAATLGYVARAAIGAVWYQKWVVHLRHRPEAGGGLVHLQKVPPAVPPKAKVDNVVLASHALAASFDRYGSYLLSQAFPEGSPTHPAYPTGHGTVAGACITALKFFFNCEQKVLKYAQPLAPAPDGLSRSAYTEPDADQMTISGELHKLAHNISFGHGIHGGIHWRSDTDESILMGERVALKFLQDQAWYYNENVSIDIKTIGGATVTVKNF